MAFPVAFLEEVQYTTVVCFGGWEKRRYFSGGEIDPSFFSTRIVTVLSELGTRLAEEGDRVLSNVGCYVVDVEVESSRSCPLVRFFVGQLDDDPMSVEKCAVCSRLLSRRLDETGEFGSDYAIEVSSPGVERRVARPRDFVRFAGRKIKVRLRTPLEGKRNFSGVISKADEKSLTLVVDGTTLVLDYARIARAMLICDLSNREQYNGSKS